MSPTADTAPSVDTAPQASYVQSLLEPAGGLGEPEQTESAPQTQTAAASEGTDPERAAAAPSGDTSKPATAPGVDDLIQHFATETGLDPNDPAQRKTLKRLADKELFIRKLQADNESLKGTALTPKPATEPEFLTDFEKELQAEGTKPAAEAKPPAQPAQPDKTAQAPLAPAPSADALKYGDVGDAWKTPEDSLTALNDAWSKNDLKTVHEVEVARMKRNFDQVIAPSLLSFVQKMLDERLKGFAEKDLGDIVPEVRRTVADRRIAESREFAIDQLRTAGAADIDQLFAAEDGPPIKFDGQEFPNTPLNRVLVKHPEIMQIQAQHTDPAKAERKTFIARYKLAYQIYKQGAAGVPAETAKKLVEAGAEMRTRQAADKTRQSINAGSGATGLGEKQPGKSYVSELVNLPGEIPLASLLS